LVGDHLEAEIRLFLEDMCKDGSVVNTHVAIGTAMGVISLPTKAYMEDIPADLIINWDHTVLKYVPVSNYTMEHKGAKRVEIAGKATNSIIFMHI